MIRIGDFKPTKEHIDIVNEIIKSGRLTEGVYVARLERLMEKYLNVKHAILTTNGTVSMQLIAHMFRTPATVCVPALTFPATINAFLLTGNKVVLCEVNQLMQMDISTLTEEQKKEIDVIVPVHLMGMTVEMDEIMTEAKKYGWYVIEDAAEAFGAEYNGKKVGTIGDFGSFSFYMSHNIGCGELGMVVTNDDILNNLLRSKKNHGRKGDPLKFFHDYTGSNYKTTEFMAGMCYANMLNVNDILEKRLNNAKYFFEKVDNENLQNMPILKGMSPLGYCFRCYNEEYKDYICKKLNDNSVETRDMFPCLKNQKAYKGMFNGDFEVAEHLEKVVFYVGVHQHLTKKDKEKIVKILNDN